MANTWDLPSEGCTNAVVAPEVPCATHNLCILGIDNRIYRIMQEMSRNVSSRATGILEDDKERFDSYYAELLSFIELAGTGMQDFHYLVQFKLTDVMEVVINTENEAVNSAMHYLIGADITARISQSTRINDGLIASDKKDITDAVVKSKSMIDSMFDNFNPMDMPQSNPRQPVTMPTA